MRHLQLFLNKPSKCSMDFVFTAYPNSAKDISRVQELQVATGFHLGLNSEYRSSGYLGSMLPAIHVHLLWKHTIPPIALEMNISGKDFCYFLRMINSVLFLFYIIYFNINIQGKQVVSLPISLSLREHIHTQTNR